MNAYGVDLAIIDGEIPVDRETDILEYVQNRMSPERRDMFQAELASDPSLAAEVDVMTAARLELANDMVPEGAAAEGWERLSAVIAPVANDNRPPVFRYLRVAAAAAVVAVGTWHFAVLPTFFAPGEATFQTASQAAEQPDVTLVFQDTATVAEISDLLLQLNGKVVDGPSALGTYQVRFGSDEERDAAIAELEARSGLVSSVFIP